MFTKEFIETCIMNADKEVDLLPIYEILTSDMDFNFPKKLQIFLSIIPLLKFRKFNCVHFHLCKRFMRHIRLNKLETFYDVFDEMYVIRDRNSDLYKLHAYHVWVVYQDDRYLDKAIQYIQSEDFVDDRGFMPDLQMFIKSLELYKGRNFAFHHAYSITKQMLSRLIENFMLDELFECLEVFLSVGADLGLYKCTVSYVENLMSDYTVLRNESYKILIVRLINKYFDQTKIDSVVQSGFGYQWAKISVTSECVEALS